MSALAKGDILEVYIPEDILILFINNK